MAHAPVAGLDVYVYPLLRKCHALRMIDFAMRLLCHATPCDSNVAPQRMFMIVLMASADSDGTLLEVPPLIRAIAKDPVLNKTKLIAEPWDIGGYQVGSFPNWDIWAEWNGMYRDVVRRFVRGDLGMKKDLATRLAGSADLYHNHNRCGIHDNVHSFVQGHF